MRTEGRGKSIGVAAGRHRPLAVIDLMLFLLALMSALLVGYGMAEGERVPWLQMMVFAVALTVFVIRDLEYPRQGLVRVDAADQLLIETLQGLTPR